MIEIKPAHEWNCHFGYPIQAWKLAPITKSAHVTRAKFLRVLDKIKLVPRESRWIKTVKPTTWEEQVETQPNDSEDEIHEPTTPVAPVAEPTTPVVEKMIPCRENCGKRYRHQSGEARHYREYHLKKPRTCRKESLHVLLKESSNESATSLKIKLEATENDLTKALEKVKQLETVIERLRVTRQRRASKKFIPTMSGAHI